MAISRKHIDKVFSQKFSLLDQKILAEYFKDEHLNEETKLVVKEQWDQFSSGPDDQANLDHVLYKLYYTINNQEEAVLKGRNLFQRISRIAALLIIGMLAVTTIYFANKKEVVKDNQLVEFKSHGGFRSQFILPDGTTGWLGYGSELKYHTDNNNRIVDLNGLAFFDVTHLPKNPFIVKTSSHLNIQVLGTRFNVCSYSEDKSCEIVLEQGSVQLNLQGKKVGDMAPNERVIYHTDNNTIEKSSVDVVDYLAWKDGKLILNNVSIEETCLKLGRFYNVEFEIQSKNI